jgi:hypothetical protein
MVILSCASANRNLKGFDKRTRIDQSIARQLLIDTVEFVRQKSTWVNKKYCIRILSCIGNPVKGPHAAFFGGKTQNAKTSAPGMARWLCD